MPLSRYLPTFSNGGGHPTALIEVYMKYGRLADACDIASTIISNVNGSIALEMKTRSDVGDSWMSGSIIPHDVLDQLMARCETTLKYVDVLDVLDVLDVVFCCVLKKYMRTDFVDLFGVVLMVVFNGCFPRLYMLQIESR
jgi:hypothetical protein